MFGNYWIMGNMKNFHLLIYCSGWSSNSLIQNPLLEFIILEEKRNQKLVFFSISIEVDTKDITFSFTIHIILIL